MLAIQNLTFNLYVGITYRYKEYWYFKCYFANGMKNWIRYCLLIGVICLCSLSINAQTTNNPPPPQNKAVDTGCGEGGTGNPPPPGLCLPIDDYVYYLLAGGLIYGVLRINKIAKA